MTCRNDADANSGREPADQSLVGRERRCGRLASVGSPPRISARELERALTRIDSRHAAHDSHYDEMGLDPRELLEHLRRHSAGLPHHVQADDVADALVVDAALWWQERERHRALLRRARSLGMSLSEIGARLGLSSKSAVRDHLDRLDALVELTAPADFARTPAPGCNSRSRVRPDGIESWNGVVPAVHDVARARRRLAAAATSDQAWLDVHGPTVLAVITRLVNQIERALPHAAHGKDSHVFSEVGDVDDHHAPRYGAAARAATYPVGDPDHDLGEWVDELRTELDTATDGGGPGPAVMATLALTLGELDVHPAAHGLDAAHGLHRARRAGHRLRAAYGDRRTPRGV